MPVTRKFLDRVADRLYGNGKTTYRISIKSRIAPNVVKLIDMLAGDDEDGDTLRLSLLHWRRAERPVIAVHAGDVSTCRIDGPWQQVGGRWIPLGGLVQAPGITWHLSPFAAQALHKHMQKVIEAAINAWVDEHGPEDRCHVPAEINREQADQDAKAMIAARALDWQPMPTGPIFDPERPSDV